MKGPVLVAVAEDVVLVDVVEADVELPDELEDVDDVVVPVEVPVPEY
jgi:hypothetical protein